MLPIRHPKIWSDTDPVLCATNIYSHTWRKFYGPLSNDGSCLLCVCALWKTTIPKFESFSRYRSFFIWIHPSFSPFWDSAVFTRMCQLRKFSSFSPMCVDWLLRRLFYEREKSVGTDTLLNPASPSQLSRMLIGGSPPPLGWGWGVGGSLITGAPLSCHSLSEWKHIHLYEQVSKSRSRSSFANIFRQNWIVFANWRNKDRSDRCWLRRWGLTQVTRLYRFPKRTCRHVLVLHFHINYHTLSVITLRNASVPSMNSDESGVMGHVT